MSEKRLLFSLTEAELDAKLEQLVADAAAVRAEPAPALVDRAALAKALSCSTKTVDRLRELPGFPELALFDSPRFEVASVVAFVKAQSQGQGLRVIGGGK
jgi:hypothetical protein